MISSKVVTTLTLGDRVVVETAGGAGYGDPAKRDAEALDRDLRNGKVSAEAAARDYGRRAPLTAPRPPRPIPAPGPGRR